MYKHYGKYMFIYVYKRGSSCKPEIKHTCKKYKYVEKMCSTIFHIHNDHAFDHKIIPQGFVLLPLQINCK